MGAEIILYYADLFGPWKLVCQSLKKQGILAFSPLRVDLSNVPTGQRLNGRQKRTGTEFFIGVMLLAHLPTL